jgi:hypothetical protein
MVAAHQHSRLSSRLSSTLPPLINTRHHQHPHSPSGRVGLSGPEWATRFAKRKTTRVQTFVVSTQRPLHYCTSCPSAAKTGTSYEAIVFGRAHVLFRELTVMSQNPFADNPDTHNPFADNPYTAPHQTSHEPGKPPTSEMRARSLPCRGSERTEAASSPYDPGRAPTDERTTKPTQLN